MALRAGVFGGLSFSVNFVLMYCVEDIALRCMRKKPVTRSNNRLVTLVIVCAIAGCFYGSVFGSSQTPLRDRGLIDGGNGEIIDTGTRIPVNYALATSLTAAEEGAYTFPAGLIVGLASGIAGLLFHDSVREI